MKDIKKCNLVIFGYGAQGRSQALNLADGGYNITVCLPETSLSIGEVKSSNFELITDPMRAAAKADIAVFLVPDAVAPALYNEVESSLPMNATLIFAHGLNIHYGKIRPREDLDVILVAPMSHGDAVRRDYLDKIAIPVLVAVARNVTGSAWEIAKGYAKGIGSTDERILETTFREETETDLFSEQALICGGLWGLITAAFDTLVDAGYSHEMAYYCCLRETQIMSEMFARFGILGTFERISDTARFGALSRGPRIIDEHVRDEMKKALHEIKDGSFIKELEDEMENNSKERTYSLMKKVAEHRLESIHKKLKY